MSADTSVRTGRSITLASAGDIAAGLPYLLGFHPTDSLVCLWLHDGALVVAQRADLPADGPTVHEADVRDYVQAYLRAAAHVVADEVIAVIVTKEAPAATAIRDALHEQLRVRCRAAVQVHGSQVREIKDAIGPWQWIDARTRQAAARAFGGVPPALSRGRIENECDADQQEALDMGPYAPGNPKAIEELVGHFDAIVSRGGDSVSRAGASAQRLTVSDRHLRDGSAHARGRDAVLVACAQADHHYRHELLAALLRCTRATPAGRGANIAAATAVVAWLCGDGVRANIALERCFLDDPEHVLGRVFDDAMSVGVPPTSIAQMLTHLA